VHRERIRAHLKHGAAGNSREDQPWDEHEWLAILTEELGEVAHELTYDQSGNPRDLRKELVQVAAMACAWIAAIDEFTA
jgi:NTP pyrophosphatase (non-canonical NTP hydrolase)